MSLYFCSECKCKKDEVKDGAYPDPGIPGLFNCEVCHLNIQKSIEDLLLEYYNALRTSGINRIEATWRTEVWRVKMKKSKETLRPDFD